MKIRRLAVSGIVGAVAFGTLVCVAPTAQADSVPAAGTCSDAVRITKQHLAQAGAPTGANDWQSVRNAAQNFVNSHPGGGSGVEALKNDVNDLNRLCAP
ncbi:hypothetical protein [Streptomyces celluloflavus]|uniref:hypothetical protein n=1 Tax=Streptomyces celluloflavus TaxID=58344 RepID=UPI00365E4A29